MNSDPISIAVEAQKEGFAYITNLLNGVLPKGIRFEEGNENASLDNAMYRMRQALPALRTIYPGVFPPDDRMIHPWTLGCVNGVIDDAIYVCVVRDHVHDQLNEAILILTSCSQKWTRKDWIEHIVEPVQNYQKSQMNIIIRLEESTENGVSLFDCGMAIEQDMDCARGWVNRFSSSGKLKATPIGRCPNDARARLYRLPEILRDLDNFLSLSVREKARIRVHLERVKRPPK
ncbi:MAG: hypothetical protein ACK5YR_00660 [Pirellula sp.]